MNGQELQKQKKVVLGISGFLILISLLGTIDVRNLNYAGYTLGPDNVFTAVTEDSPAEQAGMQVGDQLVSVNGIDVDDIWASFKQRRGRIGETRSYTVKREESTLPLEITYSGLPTNSMIMNLCYSAVGFAFLLSGVFVFNRIQNKTTLFLALAFLGLGTVFINRLYFDSYALRGFFNTILNAGNVFSVAFLVHLLLRIPEPRAWLRKRFAMPLLYTFPTALVGFVLLMIIFTPANFSPQFLGALSGVYFGSYLLLSVIIMIRAFVKASTESRQIHGLRLMLYGIVLGLAPALVATISGLIAPNFSLPGATYYFFTMVAIPISFAYAALRREASPQPATVSEPAKIATQA